MGGRSRIRWHKVAKLALAGFGCLALFMGLPSLIRRPEPPPLDPDIGFAQVAAPRQPAPSGSRSRPGPRRRGAKDAAGHRRRAHDPRPRGSRREQEPPSAPSPVAGDSAPPPVLTPIPAAAAAPPPPAPPPAPPAARGQPSQAAAESEFGFER